MHNTVQYYKPTEFFGVDIGLSTSDILLVTYKLQIYLLYARIKNENKNIFCSKLNTFSEK